MKQKYYSVNEILKHNAQYNILYGERSNGKSYAVKHHCLKKAYKKNAETFVLLRRYELENKPSQAESYFADANVELITNNEFNCITVYRGKIYFSKYDAEIGKVERGRSCGRILALSGAVHYKSQAFPDVEDIIYEEFLTRNTYLPDEPNTLQDLVSTIARRRSITVWCIGNTISRVCPYFRTWELRGIPKQKQGTIDDYIYNTDQIDENGQPVVVKIAVEYCANSGNNSKMFFGEHSKAITGGAWETHEQPHPVRDLEQCQMLYELKLICNGFKFVIQLYSNDDGGLFVYVYPFTGTRNIYRVIQSDFSDLPTVTNYFMVDKIQAERYIVDCLKHGKTCYSDNLTGDEFKQCMALLKMPI